MFFPCSLIATVTLALLTAATPVANPHSGTALQLKRRPALTNKNGVFDKDLAILRTVTTKNKHRQNMINLLKNQGSFSKKGQFVQKLAKLPAHVLSRLHLGKRQAEPLQDLDNDVEWAGFGTIGGQNFLIDFDTGSADLWVPSSSCKSTTCSKKRKYNAKKSSTSVKKPGNFSIAYGDGSTVSGPVYQDTVNIAGVKVKKQYFSPVTTLSPSFENDTIDGILGLAFPSISNLGQSPYFNSAIKSKAVKTQEFGFFLDTAKSELYLGGVNHARFEGDLEYHQVDNSSGFWEIPNASATINGTVVASKFSTIIDSGTTIMYGPPAVVKQIYAQVNGSKLEDEEQGLYSFPCENIPKFAFNWGGASWPIASYNFNIGTTDNGTTTCVGALAGADLGLGDNVWLLGDSFMKNTYTAFSFEKNAVGFGKLPFL